MSGVLTVNNYSQEASDDKTKFILLKQGDKSKVTRSFSPMLCWNYQRMNRIFSLNIILLFKQFIVSLEQDVSESRVYISDAFIANEAVAQRW